MSRQKKVTNKRGKKDLESNDVVLSSKCPFDVLLDELVLNIFTKIRLAKIEDLSIVCTRWRQLTTRQEFWRFHAIHKWGEDIVPNSYAFTSESIQVDLKKYLIPTFKSGNTTAIDWRKYFKIRYFFEEVKFALDRHYYLMREEREDPMLLDEHTGERTVLVHEGLTQLPPAYWEDLDDGTWSVSTDEDDIEYGEYLDDEDYRKALKLDDEEDDEASVDFENYDEDALNPSVRHRYTEDLYTSSISKFFMRVPRRETAKLDLPERFPKLLCYFSLEVFPLLLEAKFYAELIVATRAIFRSHSHFFVNDALSQSSYDMCLLVEDKPRLMVPLLSAACRNFDGSKVNEAQKTLLKNILEKLLTLTNSEKCLAANEEFNKVLRDYIEDFDEESDERIIVESFINPINDRVLEKENRKKKRSMKQFVDPIQRYELFGICWDEAVPKTWFSKNEAFVGVLIDFIVQKFKATKNNAEKVMLLTLSDIDPNKTMEYCLELFPLACKATKDKNNDVAFAAYTLLYRKMSAELSSQFTEKFKLTVFEELLRGLDRFPENSLCIIVMLTKLLKNNGNIISDKQLAEMNAKILANMTKPAEFFYPDVLATSKYFLFDKFHKLGHIFQTRMKPYLPKYRKAILSAGKSDLLAAKVLSWRGDKEIRELNTSPQRWVQYALLGRICGGKEFEEDEKEFVREIMKFHESQRKRDELSSVTENEFHALFADTIISIIGPKAKQKLTAHMEKFLSVYPADILAYGKKYFTGQESSHGYFPRTPIPETSMQFLTALNALKMTREGKIEKIGTEQGMVQLIYSHKHEDKKQNEKSNKRKFPAAFNDIKWEENSQYWKQMKMKRAMNQFTYKISKTRLLDVLEYITDEKLLLKAYHIIIAFAKNEEVEFDVLEKMFWIYEQLKEKFNESTQCFYVNTMINIVGNRMNDKNIDSHLRAILYNEGNGLIAAYYRNKHVNYSPMVGIVSFIIQMDWLPPAPQFTSLTYDALKLMLLKSPLGLYQAMARCAHSKLLFIDHPEDNPLDPRYVERLHSIALLGFHFGMFLIYVIQSNDVYSEQYRKLKRVKYEDLGNRITDYLKRVDRQTVKPQMIDRMERFLVLFKVCEGEGIISKMRFANLYNAAFYETAAIKKIIRAKKFTTGIADLDKRVKSWEGVYDLTKDAFFCEDEEDDISDDEDEMDEDSSE